MTALLRVRAGLPRRPRDCSYQGPRALTSEESQKQTLSISFHSAHRKSTLLAFLLGFLRLTFTLGESLDQRDIEISQSANLKHQFPLAKLHLKAKDTELGLYLSYASLGFTSTPCRLLRLFILLAAYSQSPAVSVPPNTDADAQLETLRQSLTSAWLMLKQCACQWTLTGQELHGTEVTTQV